jgi:hypothetical protein
MRSESPSLNDLTRNIVLWVVIAIVLLAVFSNSASARRRPTSWFTPSSDRVRSGGVRTRRSRAT